MVAIVTPGPGRSIDSFFCQWRGWEDLIETHLVQAACTTSIARACVPGDLYDLMEDTRRLPPQGVIIRQGQQDDSTK